MTQKNKMQVYFNSEIDKNLIENIRKIDKNFSPRLFSALNRTIIDTKNNVVVQLDINYNICEIILPNNQEIFKKYMLRYIIEFIIDSLKKIGFPVRLINEIGYKIYFYTPEGSAGSNDQWWKVDPAIQIVKLSKLEAETIFGVPLKATHNRFILSIQLNDDFTLISERFSNSNTGFVVNCGFGTNISENTGFGSQTNNTSFGGFGTNTSANSGFGANTSANSGFGTNTSANTGFGTNTPTNTGFGTNTPTNTGFGTNTSANTGFGTNTGFGSFGTSNTTNFGGFSFGAPNNSNTFGGFGTPNVTSFGSLNTPSSGVGTLNPNAVQAFNFG